MAVKGQRLVNPQTGDVFEFLETSADSDGKRVIIRSTVHTKGDLVPNHFHALQDETFLVESGTLTVRVDGTLREFHSGETITLKKNIPHNHFNATDEPVVYVHTTEPALDFEFFIQNLVGLATDGKMPGGKSSLAQQLTTLRGMESKAFLADIPMGLQNILLTIVPPVARLFGVKAFYRKYTGFDR